ncbi:hypothetical protein [Pseudoruegeria sp. HB172150]|uniref:hypothetical protein n=1 Tax=Pseudoruegeria sp. HB172150 TaxID=2721164 RepID=UPI00155419DA|nr:hypothetical protein [Pseudoruegeria sp. HB172150]
MKKSMAAMAVACALTACGGNPFLDDGDDGDSSSIGDVTLPEGDETTASSSVERYETEGEARDIVYDSSSDTISINNLPFDADGVYDRDNVLPTLLKTPDGTYTLYENNNKTERRAYKALRGESPSGETSFTVVRTGDYIEYGFGGFVYARNGGVNLPSSGQATFEGDYAGIRVFNGVGGLEYTTGDAILEVDFEDFDATDAVEGFIYNRQIFNQAGTAIGTLPFLTLRTGSISDAGEIAGTLGSELIPAGETELQAFESGQYYAVLSGNPADEIAGIIVITGDDPDDVLDGGFTVQETGGFIVNQTNP